MGFTRAIILGISNYSRRADYLPCAWPSAKLLAQTLRDHYQFDDVGLVPESEATLDGVAERLSLLRTMKPGDAALVAFCGHAKRMGNRWYLVPADASMEDTGHRRFLPDYELLREYVEGSPASHILLVIDACYSGLLLRLRGVVNDAVSADEAVVGELMSPERPSRYVITSGDASQPVPDAGGAGVSLFMEEFCAYLRNSPARVLPATTIGSEVRQRVLMRITAAEIKQSPQANHIAGDTSGVFCFVRRGTPPPSWDTNTTVHHRKILSTVTHVERPGVAGPRSAVEVAPPLGCLNGSWMSKLPLKYDIVKKVEAVEKQLREYNSASGENVKTSRQMMVELGRGQFDTYLKVLGPEENRPFVTGAKALIESVPEGAIELVLFMVRKLLGSEQERK